MHSDLLIKSAMESIKNINSIEIVGKISAVHGVVAECVGLSPYLKVGSQCKILKDIHHMGDSGTLYAEVIAMHDNIAVLMPYGDTIGIGVNDSVVLSESEHCLRPDDSWLGRVIDAFARPLDSKGDLKQGIDSYSIKSTPLNAHQRNRLGQKISLGVKSIDCFASCCIGQRMGIFSGSGIGKSMLIAMITKYSDADIKVIGLIGERGREVQEFLQEYLGESGLQNTIVVVATGDEPALMRRRAAYVTMTIAEYFRDLGKEVLCIMDSITRFAMAQREIGLSRGEPPTTKGYTPSVFSELPRLLERAGPGITKPDGTKSGNITALFSVLVEGDDTTEPICDAARSILDGHIVLDREIAENGRYPAVNILKSVSRSMPLCQTEQENKVVTHAKKMESLYNKMIDMIRLGAYKIGTDKDVDEAIKYHATLEEFLNQKPHEHSPMINSFSQLFRIYGIASQ